MESKKEPLLSKKEKVGGVLAVIIAITLLLCLGGLNKLEELGKYPNGEKPKIEIKIEEETYHKYLESLVDKKIEVIEGSLNPSDRLSLYGTLKKVYSEGSFEHFKDVINQNLNKNPYEIEEFNKNFCKVHFNGNFDEYLNKAKQEGLILEQPSGFIMRLE